MAVVNPSGGEAGHRGLRPAAAAGGDGPFRSRRNMRNENAGLVEHYLRRVYTSHFLSAPRSFMPLTAYSPSLTYTSSVITCF